MKNVTERTPERQAGHTPGPWTVITTKPRSLHIFNNEAARTIVDTGAMDVYPLSEADLRLIAAAPEMLAALIEVQRAIANDRDGEQYTHPVHGKLALEEVKYLIVDAAIAAATGEPQ